MEIQYLQKNIFIRAVTSGKMFTFTMSAYLLGIYLHARKDQNTRYKVSFSRHISRMTGHLCNLTIPSPMRSPIYKAFGKVYGVNFDDILVEDLQEFRNFN